MDAAEEHQWWYFIWTTSSTSAASECEVVFSTSLLFVHISFLFHKLDSAPLSSGHFYVVLRISKHDLHGFDVLQHRFLTFYNPILAKGLRPTPAQVLLFEGARKLVVP